MEYNVKHDEKRHRFEYDRNGLMAFVEYDLEDGVMDIFHTLVPIPMEGMGVGSALMKYALDYARGCPKSIWHPRFIRIPIGD